MGTFNVYFHVCSAFSRQIILNLYLNILISLVQSEDEMMDEWMKISRMNEGWMKDEWRMNEGWMKDEWMKVEWMKIKRINEGWMNDEWMKDEWRMNECWMNED